MQIKNSTQSDLPDIFRLYRLATDFQRSKKKVVVWPEFDKRMVEMEINENRQWKILIDGEVACVWVITFSDEQIWEERNIDSAVYIHRIATNPNFRGYNFVGVIVDWARTFAKANDKRFIRLDTIGENIGLIQLYTKAGFNYLGLFDLKNRAGLPEHYQQGLACLFEIDLNV